jgi:hypothetical protein
MTHRLVIERIAFERWVKEQAPHLGVNWTKETEIACWAAWQAATRWEAVHLMIRAYLHHLGEI